MNFTKTQLKQIDRILRDPGNKVIATLEQMRQYARHSATEDRKRQREGRREAAKVTAAGRRFLDALAAVDPIGGAKPVDAGGLERRSSPASLPSPAGEPSGSMRLVWQRGGDHRDILAADRAVRRVLELLRPASGGEGGRTSKAAIYENVICDLATIYRRRARKRPTSSPTGPFAELVRVVTRLDNPKDEIAAALSRKPRRKS